MEKAALQRLALWAREWLTAESAAQTGYACFYRITALYYMKENALLPENVIFPPETETQLYEAFSMLHAFMPAAFPDALPQQPDMQVVSALLARMEQTVPHSDWTEGPQLLGWLYQFYHAKDKDAAFASLAQGEKITAKQLPAATQLFTPDWIVQYLTQNSLGRLLLACHPTLDSTGWRYDIEQEHPVSEPTALTEIRLLDPCMGSGHILLEAFELLMQAYLAKGYAAKEAVRSIFVHNLFGLDIDEKVVQLARFVLLMQACRYDPEAWKCGYELQLYAVPDGDTISPDLLAEGDAAEMLRTWQTAFSGGSLYGSLLRLPQLDRDALVSWLQPLPEDVRKSDAVQIFDRMLKVERLLKQTYAVVVTNPPYMGKKSLDRRLSGYLAAHYPEGKSELYAAFMLRCLELTEPQGYTAMLTIHSWMFLRSFAPLRRKLLHTSRISTLLHTGAGTFEELNAFNALAAAFCLRKGNFSGARSQFICLCDYYSSSEKQRHFHDREVRYTVQQEEFLTIPDCPLLYRLSDAAAQNFTRGKPISAYARPKQGMATADNKRFVRYWFEVPREHICFDAENAEQAAASGCRWFPYNKGGGYRKWYGANWYVVDWEKDGARLKAFDRAVLRNKADYFKAGITWSLFGFENFAVRYKKAGFLFDVSGSSCFPPKELTLYMLAFLGSKAAFYYLSRLAPTVNFQVGNIAELPLILDEQRKPEIERLCRACIRLSEEEWDDYEESWDFCIHPLLRYSGTLADRFAAWSRDANARYRQLKRCEEQINAHFLDIYRLSDELLPEVVPRDIALRAADKGRDVRSFLSFAVGCMLGRYAVEGTDYAALLLLTLDDDSEHGIIACLEAWLKAVLGAESLACNLRFIADALGGEGTPQEIILRYFSAEFYEEHCRKYKKLPIYWMLDSRHGFRALFYVHRWEDGVLRLAADLCPPAEKDFAKQLLALTPQTPDFDLGIAENYRRFASVLTPLRSCQ